jgi:hypothetical protein
MTDKYVRQMMTDIVQKVYLTEGFIFLLNTETTGGKKRVRSLILLYPDAAPERTKNLCCQACLPDRQACKHANFMSPA